LKISSIGGAVAPCFKLAGVSAGQDRVPDVARYLETTGGHEAQQCVRHAFIDQSVDEVVSREGDLHEFSQCVACRRWGKAPDKPSVACEVLDPGVL
jgi:hypothetical protein